MTDIPEDIMRAANEAYESYATGNWRDIRECIARAILAERERCAWVARHLNGWGADCGRGGHAEHIAKVILMGSPPASAAWLPDEHTSDCAVHNEPAFPAGPCDCGAERAKK